MDLIVIRLCHRALHVLLAGLVVLGGLPRYELRHVHADGGDPHRHGRAELRGDSEAHRHHEGHHHERQTPGHHHDDAVGSDKGRFAPSLKDADWHTHLTWFGGLADEHSRPSCDGGEDAEVDRFPTPLFVLPKGPSDASSWSKTLSLLQSLHGPPAWSAAESLAHTSRLLCAPPDRGPSPPLCDRARQERSGVQLT